jgi:hypothetical protein
MHSIFRMMMVLLLLLLLMLLLLLLLVRWTVHLVFHGIQRNEAPNIHLQYKNQECSKEKMSETLSHANLLALSGPHNSSDGLWLPCLRLQSSKRCELRCWWEFDLSIKMMDLLWIQWKEWVQQKHMVCGVQI